MTRRQMSQYGALGSWGLFGILALLARYRFALLTRVDQWGLADLHRHLSAGGIRWFHAISTVGSPVVTGGLLAILAGYCWWRHRRDLAAFLATLLVGGDALAWVAKQLVARPRPVGPVFADSGYSFPSGHVFGAMLLAWVLWTLVATGVPTGHLKWSLNLLIGLGVLLVLAARLFLRAHYPSDTLASLLLATAWWWQLCVWWPLNWRSGTQKTTTALGS